jgi:hypothetical protein
MARGVLNHSPGCASGDRALAQEVLPNLWRNIIGWPASAMLLPICGNKFSKQGLGLNENTQSA